jgi:NTE family protein
LYGLVLEGGGARGAYQIGAWKALSELGIEIRGVAGTSVGALNGAMVVQDDLEKAYDIWYNMTYSRVMKLEDDTLERIRELSGFPENFHALLRAVREIFKEKGIDISPLRQLLERCVSEEKIRNSGRDFGIITVSLTDFKPLELYIEDIPAGRLVDYLIASANLPFFKLEKIDGKLFIDGGFFDNLPIKLLTEKGYRDIIVVRLYGMGRTRRVNKKGLNIITVNPSEDPGGTLDFSTERARKNLNLGYYDTLRVFRGYLGRDYYIDAEGLSEDYCFNIFLNLSQSAVLKMARVLGISENIPYRRLLFEKVVPRLSDLLDLGDRASYRDILLGILERAASSGGARKFKIYGFEEFMKTVLDNHRPAAFSKKIPRLLKAGDMILLRTVKNQLIHEVSDILLSELKKIL